ncbi:MAG: hypothetical protein ABJL67_21800 [Sulfitobacter sp.]
MMGVSELWSVLGGEIVFEEIVFEEMRSPLGHDDIFVGVFVSPVLPLSSNLSTGGDGLRGMDYVFAPHVGLPSCPRLGNNPV